MIFRIFAWVGTVASIIGLIVSLHPSGQPLNVGQGILIGVVAVGFLSLIIWDIWGYLKSGHLSFNNAAEINDYMYSWISRGGRVVIFTRDMSWAQDQRIRDLLVAKARRNELAICLPQMIPFSEELQRDGARVISYGELNYVPQSRFTIINKDRMDAHVAVGRGIGNKHVVEEFSVGQHPVFAVANDLIEILDRMAERGH